MSETASKSEFARLINLSPGRVTQMVREGKLNDCLVGQGPKARIIVDKAIEKLKLRRDVGQALGNGSKAKLAGTEPSEVDDIELKIKRAKLEEAEVRNRRLREDELVRRGVLVRADDVSAETIRTVSTIVSSFESEMAAVAHEMAARFKVPERDLAHMLRKQMRSVRSAVAQKLRVEAEALPQFIEVDLESISDSVEEDRSAGPTRSQS